MCVPVCPSVQVCGTCSQEHLNGGACAHLEHSETERQIALFIEDATGGAVRRKEKRASLLFSASGCRRGDRDPESCSVPLRMSRETEPGWGGDWPLLAVCPSVLLFLNTEPAPSTGRSRDKGPIVSSGGQTQKSATEPEAGQRTEGWEPGAELTTAKEVSTRHEQGGISPSLVTHTCPGPGRLRLGEVGDQSQRPRYKSRASRVGMGLTAAGEGACGSQSWGHEGGRGHRQPSLPTGFLGGGAQAGALPQRVLVVAGTAPAPAVPATDAADSRDAAAAVGHVAAADRAGPEAIATAAAGAADDGCRGRAGQHPSGRAGVELRGSHLPQDRWGCPWRDALCGGSGHSCPSSRGKCPRDSFPHVLLLACPAYSQSG